MQVSLRKLPNRASSNTLTGGSVDESLELWNSNQEVPSLCPALATCRGFALGSQVFKSLAVLVNSQLVRLLLVEILNHVVQFELLVYLFGVINCQEKCLRPILTDHKSSNILGSNKVG